MTLDKVKVYLDGKMVVFATQTDELIASVPPGQFRIKPTDGDGFAFEDLVNNKTIAAVKDYDDVLDAAGATYGANQADVLTALNAFVGFKSGGGVGIADSYRNIAQRFYTPNSFANTSILANNLYTFKIKVENTVQITEFTININTPAVSGNAVAGLYSLGTDGEPSELIVQTSTPFDLSVSGQQVSVITTTEIQAGFYCIAYLADTAATLRAFNGDYPNFGGGFGGFMYARLLTALAYSATLPASHPAGGNYSDSNLPEVLITTL
jgi:hypothetical protein